MKQLVVFLIPLVLLSCSPKQKAAKEIELVAQREFIQTFDWSAYYFKQGNQKLNPKDVKFDLIGNVEHQISDTALWIMPLDTSQILIELGENPKKRTYGLRALSNHLIDSSWYNVPMGQFPTPLDNNSFKAWANFSKFRILGQKVPEFRHYDYLTLDTVTSDIFRGKTTLLNFWYRGCAPCMAEMPALKKLKEEWEQHAEVQFISVCLDSLYFRNDSTFVLSDKIHSSSPIPEYCVETGFRHVGDGKAIADSFQVRAYPTNLIIDQDGVARKVMTGAKIEDSNDELARNLTREIKRIQESQKLDREINLKKVKITE
jgi:thiol-disulfide isomerase/thioredoxin